MSLPDSVFNGAAGTSVVLLARYELDRRAFSELLGAGGIVVKSTGDATPAAIDGVAAVRPHLAVIVLDNTDSAAELIAAARRLRSAVQTRVAVVGCDERQRAEWAEVADVFVLRSQGVDELRSAIRSVAPIGALPTSEFVQRRFTALTKTEAELLPLLASGLTLRDAAKSLSISYKTADNSRTRLFRKLGLRDRVELARFAIREGILPA